MSRKRKEPLTPFQQAVIAHVERTYREAVDVLGEDEARRIANELLEEHDRLVTPDDAA